MLSVDDESSSDNRTVIVKLQDDIYGVGKVTPGSQIEIDETPDPSTNPPGEELLGTLVVVILVWLMFMAIFTYPVILQGG